jgi:hypothetical protein
VDGTVTTSDVVLPRDAPSQALPLAPRDSLANVARVGVGIVPEDQR